MEIEDVVNAIGNRFAAVVVAARRARQINAYFSQLGGGIGEYVPPQCESGAMCGWSAFASSALTTRASRSPS